MHSFRKSVLAILVVLFIQGCSTVPLTGRSQLSLVSRSTVFEQSFEQYKAFLKDHSVVEGTDNSRTVQRIGQRIRDAVEMYFAGSTLESELSAYEWEFNLIESEEVNAWCMPGGKVVVYSGILPLTQNENGLAVVLGHEIAHAIARHGQESMSQALLIQLGGTALSSAFEKSPNKSGDVWLQAYGIGANLGFVLPYSRLQENEADKLGLIFMALAGYNPQEAVHFWNRMREEKKGGERLVFLSTHPADQQRIENIQEFLPEAMKYYPK